MAKPSTMATHRYHSWGRTRGPKNLARPEQATEAATSTSAPSGVGDGYATENQMYLHMLLDTTTSTDSRTVTVYGWNHAFGVWFELTEADGDHTAVTIAANSAQVHKIYNIAGTDRVFFKIDSALNASDEFFAACSTI